MKKTITYNISKKTIFMIVFIFGITFCNTTKLFGQNWKWAISGSGSASEYSGTSCTDASGNIIISGSFYSSPLQMGTVTLNNAGGGDGYLAKVNPNGSVIWALKIGGSGNEAITGVCTDASGNIYVHGNFNSAFLTVPPLTVSNFSNTGTYDVFVACFNSSGIIQWFKSYGGLKDESSGGCAFSNQLSCLYIGGSYNSSTLVMNTNTVTNTDATGTTKDLFLARLTSTGTATWLKTGGSSTSNDVIVKVEIDSNSDPYYNGFFAPTSGLTTSIGSTLLTTYGGQDMIAGKYTSAGTPVWVKNFGGSINCSCDFIGGLSIDASNNVFVSGTYSGASLVAGSFTLTNSGGYDAFAAKLNSTGVFQWANKIGALGDQYSNSITTDNAGNVFVTGSFSGTNVVVGTTTLTNNTPGTSTDIYVLKYNNAGTTQWGLTAAGPGADEQGNDVSCDASGNIYVSGNIYTSPTVFGTSTITSTGVNDVFLARISCLTATVSGVSTVCSGSSATLTATGATNYTWSTGATTSSVIITPTTSATYSVVGAIGTCTGSSNNLNVSLLPASISMGPNLNLLCSSVQIPTVTTSPASPSSVTWIPNNNGISSTTTLTPAFAPIAPYTQYTVTATLNNGCVVSGTLGVTQYAQKPDICLVTVDTMGINNEIFWEKTLYADVDSFIVYREVSTNVFKRIAAISVNAYSGYTDTARAIGPANGDPNTTAYKYKLQIRDVCGSYSQLSLWHQTLFIQDQQNGNFNWNAYAIESSPTPVSVYDLYRINVANNSYTLVTSTTANLATDPQYTSWQTTAKWRVQANGFNCNPTNKVSGTLDQKIKTKSNIKNDKLMAPQGIHSYALLNEVIKVYPSPAKDLLYIDGKAFANNELVVEIQNALGQIVYSRSYVAIANGDYQINVNEFTNGVYFVNIKHDNKAIAIKKIVVNK